MIIIGLLLMAWTMLIGLAVMLVLAFIMGYPVMVAWNYAMPDVFGLPELTYLQAVALFALSSWLLKGAPNNTVKNTPNNKTS